MRVIVCGSRTWSNFPAIVDRIFALPPGSTIVHGAARGADAMAGRAARARGLTEERHPAEWETRGRGAGHVRNAHMAKLGADLCIAFRCAGESRGTDDMVRRARAAGVPVEVHHEDGRVDR